MNPKPTHQPVPTLRNVPIWMTTLVGALALSLLSIPQKIILQADPLEPTGFIVPIFFGGAAGLVMGLLYNRLRSSFQQQLKNQGLALDELALSEERFRLLADNAQDVIFRWLLKEQRYEYLSPSIFTLTGFPPEDFLAKPRLMEELLISEDREVFAELSQNISNEDVPPHVEYRITHKRGHIVWINQRHSIGFNENDHAFALEGICTDITEFRAARLERLDLESQLAQSQKMDAIGRLAGGIAHDFNNLLTVINGYSDLLLDDSENQSPPPTELMEIQKAGRKAADLTSQLLAFSRKQINTPRLLDPAQLVDESLRMLSRMVGEDIRMDIQIADHLPGIYMDSIQLDQVMLNLVVNAREAMPDGGTLTVKLYSENISQYHCNLCQKDLTGVYVFLVITDTGCGMQAADMEKIFDPFFTTKESQLSTGMGLSTVFGVVHQNEGHIDVKSTPGQGSCFTLLFPAASEKPVSEIPKPESFSKRLLGSETILVAEDEPLVRSLATTVLQQYGYTVLVAEDAAKAKELFQEHRDGIDLLLTDVVMPGLSGVELSGDLLRQAPLLKVIFMSGYVDGHLNMTGIANGSHPFLKKPFGTEALARLVRQTLEANPA